MGTVKVQDRPRVSENFRFFRWQPPADPSQVGEFAPLLHLRQQEGIFDFGQIDRETISLSDPSEPNNLAGRVNKGGCFSSRGYIGLVLISRD
jgi:hypothetical protein